MSLSMLSASAPMAKCWMSTWPLEVQEELEADPRLADLGIGVQCLAGTVFLTGDIEERRQEELAVAAARRARGVTRVVSQLRYLPGNVDADAIFHSQVHNDGEQTWPWRK